MFTDKQLGKLKKMLLIEKEELLQAMAINELVSLRDSVDEFSLLSNHPADTGTELFERGKELLLHSQREEKLANVENALAQMAEGTYGICTVCQQAIDYDRLCALPYANVCLQDSENREGIREQPTSQLFHEEGINVLEMALEQGNLEEQVENQPFDVE